MRNTLLWFCFALLAPFRPSAADWPEWRGPGGRGVSSETNLPDEWSPQANIVWRKALPGRGASSPIVVGDRVYLTTQTTDTGLHVLALDRKSGDILWDREVGKGKLRAHNLHNMATPTPVSDGRRIWALFGTGDLACLDEGGRILWSRNLVADYGEYRTNHGMGTSPVLFGNRLYIACMHQGPSYLLALDASTGTTAWKKERNLPPTDESQDSYSSPLLVQTPSGAELVLAGAEHVNAYDPATGEQRWIHGGLKVPHAFGRTISGPAADSGLVLAVASGFQNRGYVVALRPRGTGELGEDARVWTNNRFAPDCPTPVIYQGMVFLLRDDGMASCLDLKTGEAHWQERLFSSDGKVSPVAGDGKVYFVNGQGQCAVVRAGESFQLLARNSLGEKTISSPAISRGQIFIRTHDHLYCVGKR